MISLFLVVIRLANSNWTNQRPEEVERREETGYVLYILKQIGTEKMVAHRTRTGPSFRDCTEGAYCS